MKRLQWTILSLVVLAGCAERKARLWIEPPIGYNADRAGRNLVYRVEDIESGKKESVLIPLTQVPSKLVLHGGPKTESSDSLEVATKADRYVKSQTLPTSENSEAAPTVSYLKGLERIQQLYSDKKFQEALISLAPLVEQYPSQARLFTMQGTLYRKLGEKKLALQSFKKSQQIDSNNPAVDEAVSTLSAEIGEAR